MITLVTGPANAGKAQVVMDSVRGHITRGEEPLLVVPTRADAEHYRRELVGDIAALGVRVERFEGLIGEMVRRAGMGGPVLGGLARERVLAAIAARHVSSGAMRDEASGATPAPDGAGDAGGAAPGYVRALTAFVAELHMRRVTPARLGQALREWSVAAGGEGSPVVEVGRLFEEYHRVLHNLGRVDEEQRASRALDALRRKPALWGERPVLFYGFDDLTPTQVDTIETLGVVVGARVTVSLTYEPGRTAFAGRAGTFQALEPLAAEHRELRVRAEYYAPRARAALSHLERSLFEPDAARVDPGGAVKLLEGGGERAELELIAREVRTLLEGSMEPGEIAVVLRGPGGAADLIEEVFGAAKIPYALQRKRPLANTAIGRGLIGLLRCVPAGGGGAAPGGVGDLLAWLRAPGLLERPELADRLEAKARRTGCSSAAQARALWEGEYWRLETIDRLRVAAEHGAQALIELARGELEWLLTASERGEASVLEREASVLESYAQDEAQALEAGRRALAELNELARIAPKLAPGDAAELARVLEGVEFVSGEGPTPGRVAVLDPLALRARRVRALFLCGLQEGEFPAPARPRPMLGEEERRRLAEVSGLWLGEREDALAAERYLLYAAVSRPEELLVLSWHTADDDGAPVAKSLFVDDVCDLFDESLSEQRVRRPLGAVDWPEFGDPAPLRPYGEDARLEPEDERAPSGRGDLVPASVGVLAPLRDEELLREMQAHTWSASSLELWMSCPVRWLVERMLRAKDLNPDPEPIARGGLAHAALKDTLEGLKLETGSARLTPARLARGRELLKRALHQNEAKFPLSTRLERRPGVRRRLEVDLERYLEHAAAADSPLEPSYLELGFGFASDDEKGEGSALEAFDLGGGVMLRGRVDRVDVGAGGEAVVYDYKGRDAPPAAKWGAQGNVQIALYMRAVEGLLGLKAAGGFYQPLAGGDLRARGVLDSDSDVEIECVRGDKREGVEVQELLEEALVVARAVAAQAGRGELEARPETCAFRGGCMYPTICRCER